MRRQVPRQAPSHPGTDLEIRVCIFTGKKVALEYPGKTLCVKHCDSGLHNSSCQSALAISPPALWPKLRVGKSKSPPNKWMSSSTSLGHQCCQPEGKEGKRRLLGGRLALPSSPSSGQHCLACSWASSRPSLYPSCLPLRLSKSSFNSFWTRVRSGAEGSKAKPK